MAACEVMLRAATLAESQSTVKRAVNVAWSALHLDGVDAMADAFKAWCAYENFGGHASGLGAVLRRRYATPAEIAHSLRQADAARHQEVDA